MRMRSSAVAAIAIVACCLLAAGCARGTSAKPAPADQSATVASVSSFSPKARLNTSTPAATDSTSKPQATSVTHACRAGQLRLTYLAGGPSGGLDFGSVNLTDATSRPCRLVATIGVDPLDWRHHVIPWATPWHNTVRAHGLRLTANGIARFDPRPPREQRWAQLLLAGEYRDDPSAPNGLCAAGNETTPVYWRVRLLSHSWDVHNYDHNGFGGSGRFQSIESCRSHWAKSDLIER